MNIRKLKGIGTRTEELFQHLDVYTTKDLMELYPRAYDSYDEPVNIAAINECGIYAVYAAVDRPPELKQNGRYKILTVMVRDEAGSMLRITWFNMPFLRSRLRNGYRYIFRGKVAIKGSLVFMEQPSIYTVDEYYIRQSSMQPVYPLTAGLTNNMVIKAVKQCFESGGYEEFLPEWILTKNDLIDEKKAHYAIHFPKDRNELAKARKRIIFDEFFLFTTNIRCAKSARLNEDNLYRITESGEALHVLKNLPYSLTGAQKKVYSEILNDMGSDKSMIQVLLYVIMVILAFIFSVTIASIIEKEASEIGTMRALGFTRGELLRHYITLPVTVTLISCVLGNILGYTVFKDVMAGMYYHSYSLPTYITLWNPYAFVITTVVPCMIMIVVNTIVLYTKLKLSPLKFLRHDLNHWREKKAVRLPKVSFMARFRMRILIQNKVNYLVMFLGVTFASLLIFFGLLMTPLLDHYGMLVEENMISDYQYVLKMPVQTKNEAAEKYAVKSLILDKTDRKLKEEINVYGIREDSDYITGIELHKNGNGVYASEGILEKYKLSVGDMLALKDEYSDDTYEFEILGTYPYPASFTLFISNSRFEELFDKEEGYFNGYFSNEELTDLDSKAVAATITYDDMTKVVRQLKDSMGQMFPLITVFSVFF